MNAKTQHHSDIDHNIDRALSALRDAQPRSGLEGRILANLEYRAAIAQPRGFHISAHLALWTATAAAILAVASMVLLHGNISRAKNAVILSEAHRTEPKNPETARSTTNVEPLSTANLSQTSVEPTRRMAHRSANSSVAMPVACAQSECPAHDGDAHAVMNGATTTNIDAQALADLHAPSHPAPPLPMTAQEKLFLRMMRYGNATQIAELNPIVRAKQDADETASFKAFFPDPAPVQQPGDNE